MKLSLRGRVTLAVCVAVVIVSVAVGVNATMASRSVTQEDSEQYLSQFSESKAGELNNMIEKIEQSVDSLSNITLSTIKDFNAFQTDASYVEECTKNLEITTDNLAMNTNGALTAYIRYNPEFTEPTSGIFLSKSGDKFEFLTPTDFSIYDPADLTHVGWYYIPVQNGKPIWMDPYLNENINVYMISYVVPIFINDISVGIVGMDIDFSQIENFVSEINAYETGYAYLVNADNNILAHKNFDTGSSLKDQLPEEYKIVSDASMEGKVVSAGDNDIIYKTLNNGMKLVITVPEEELFSKTNALSRRIVAMILLGLILSCVYAAIIGATISNPIKQLTKIIHLTADLDFATQLESNKLLARKDETGEMANEIICMRERLEEMVRNIDHSCGMLDENVAKLKEMSDGVVDIATSNSTFTEQLSAGMLQSGSAIENVQGNLLEINQNALSIEQLSKDGSSLSSEIMQRASELLTTTQAACDKTKEIYSKVKRDAENALEKSKAVEQINTLTNAIDDISSQTSLLALNASIEAARAGEAGRGFAVVATEISNLAQQTSETVSNINQIVGEVNVAVRDMARCLDESMEFVGDTVLKDYEEFGKVSEQYKQDAVVIGDNMANVSDSIVHLSSNITQIKNSMEGISDAVNEANVSINEIAGSTTEMAHKTGENNEVVADSMEKIHTLTDIVEQFKI